MKAGFCIIFLFVSTNILGQQNLSNLYAPDSPALYMLDISPTSILRPTTYETFKAAIFSNFIGESSATIPDDFVLEFSPYWATNPKMTLNEYLSSNLFGKQSIRNLKISIASTQNFILGDSSNTQAIAFGIRTTLFKWSKETEINISKEYKSFRSALKTRADIYTEVFRELRLYNIVSKDQLLESFILENIITNSLSDLQINSENLKTIISELRREVKTNGPDIDGGSATTLLNTRQNLSTFIKNTLEDFLDQYSNYQGLNSIYPKLRKTIKKTDGFTLDFAYGGLISFPENNFNTTFLPRHSIWLAPSYRFNTNINTFDFRLQFRYELYKNNFYQNYFPNSEYFENNFDLGFYVASETEKFSFGFEAVKRFSKTNKPSGIIDPEDGIELVKPINDEDFQAIGSFSYKVNDTISLSYSLGNRFDQISPLSKNLISLLSLNLGFGSIDNSNIKVY